ncbi:helix-turn-helix domain-containing protein [Salinarchaeum laminariae]|uniref:helix-turn-helix domain-containing protein n=1 Tax=Salinarchaeum laminariae TaxID=869888 RepID=UPI0020BEB62F|nr:helix-turn-helix domain-containing protein [Salinarchaeum laminariae]
MAIIIRGTVPAEEFALSHTLQELPEVEFECERIVQSGERSILPLLWVRSRENDAVEAALEADPTVDAVNCLSLFEAEALYQMQWVDHVRLLLHMITNGEATVLDAHGRDGTWQLRALYPNREYFSQTHEFVAEHGLTFDVESIREMDGDPAGRYGLTDDQYAALVEAAKRGYYDVPRSVTLEELSEELSVSHQALSEQLRRGTGALMEDTLLVGTADDAE